MPLILRETFPFNHEQAVTVLTQAEWSEKELEYIATAGAGGLHAGFGSALRNNWGLHDRTYPLSGHYRRRFGLGHADDMSHLILQNFVCWVRRESFSLEVEVSWLKKHWLDQGVDPLTLERMF